MITLTDNAAKIYSHNTESLALFKQNKNTILITTKNTNTSTHGGGVVQTDF